MADGTGVGGCRYNILEKTKSLLNIGAADSCASVGLMKAHEVASPPSMLSA
jgi:hypothetical protein